MEQETQLPVTLTQFTDRITGANRWMTDEQAAELNRYFPGSVVVCKVEIDPGGADIDGYEIEMEADEGNTANITIEDLKVVRVEVGSESVGDGVSAVFNSNSDNNPSTTEAVEFDINSTTLGELETRYAKILPDRPGTKIIIDKNSKEQA